MFKQGISRLKRYCSFHKSAGLAILLLMLPVRSADGIAAHAKTCDRPSAQAPLQQQVTVAPNAPTSTLLEADKPVESEILGGQIQSYRIILTAGQSVFVTVQQRGIDVVERVFEPEGRLVSEFDSEFRSQEPDQLGFVAETSGAYRLEVKAKVRDAVGHYEIRVSEIRAATQRDRSLDEAHRLGTESDMTFRRGKYDEAISLGARAVKAVEQTPDTDDVYLGHLLNQLGYMQREKGEYKEAESTLQRALDINEKRLGPKHPQTVYSASCLGLVYLSRNDYPKAGRMLQAGLDSSEETLGPDHPRVAFQWLNLGSLHLNLGDLGQAEKDFQHALTIAEKLLEVYDPVKPAALNNLGWLYITRKDYERAETCEQQALSIYEQTRGPEHPYLVSPLMNLGIIARERKDYPRALEFYFRALPISEKALGQDHISVGMLFNNIANIYKAKGDYPRALELQQRALNIAEKSGGRYHILTIVSIGNIANLYRVQGDVANAVAFQKRLDGRLETALSLNLAIGSERQKLAYFDSLAERTDRTISLHLNFAPDNPEAAALAALVLLQRKGRILDAMSDSLTALRERFNADDQKLIDRLNSTTAELAKLALGGPQKMEPSEYQNQLSALQEQKDKLEEAISARSAAFRTRSQPVTLAAVQAAIPPGGALIEFASYRPFDPRIEGNQYGESRYVAYILRQGGEVGWREIGPAKEIDSAVDSLRQALRDPERKDVQQLGRAVDEKVMQPLRGLLGDSSQLLISPDGQLNLIPFAALVDENGKYLLERYAITYVTSGRDLLRTRVERESKTGPLIVANPSFGVPDTEQALRVMKPITASMRRRSVTTARDLSEVYFAPLGSTELEGRTIQTLFPGATLLTGRLATESALKQTRAPEILHVATHGFFLQDSRAISSETAGMRGINTNVRIENPLMRSGLALADANMRTAGSDDGILTALEASGLNLWGTKLVVLSACDTGLGEVHNGEGVYGLRRAFVLAGAESLVMSLWPISDRSARELMTHYYQNLKSGMGRGEALRQVQLEMLKHNRQLHPFYWANFIQSGEWANLDGKR